MVSPFPANNTKVLIDLCDEGASMVYARRGYVAMADMRHGLAPCNNHNVVVYGQEHKVRLLVLLVRTSGTL